MLDRVYDVLGDVRNAPRQFPRAKVVELVNEGQMVFRRFVEDEWFRTTEDLVASQGVYTFTDQSLRAIRVAFEDVTLEPTTVQELQEIDTRWQTREQPRPRRWTTQQQMHNKYRLYPIPSISTVGSYAYVGDPNYAFPAGTPLTWDANNGTIARYQNSDGSFATFVPDESGQTASDRAFASDMTESFNISVATVLASSSGSLVLPWNADDNTLVIGFTTPFDALNFTLAVGADVSIVPEFHFSNDPDPALWSTFVPASDGTSGMQNSGVISWDAQALLDDPTPWISTLYGGSSRYFIRIRRTAAAVTTNAQVERALGLLVTPRGYVWDGDNGEIALAPPLNVNPDEGVLGTVDASGVGNLTLWLVKIPPDVSDDEESLTIKSAYQTAVLFYVLWQTYEEEGDHHNSVVAAYYRDEFRRVVERARELAANPLPYMVQKLGRGFNLQGENAALPFAHSGLDDEGNTVNFGWPRGF
jgi:hypothetical protein